MKIIFYFSHYVIFLLLGNFIKYLGIPSIYELPVLILIPFNYLAIIYGIKYPLEKRKDVKYSKIKIQLIILSSIFDTIIILIFEPTLIAWIILTLSTIIMLLLIRPKHEIIQNETQKNIDEYFSTHKKNT